MNVRTAEGIVALFKSETIKLYWSISRTRSKWCAASPFTHWSDMYYTSSSKAIRKDMMHFGSMPMIPWAWNFVFWKLHQHPQLFNLRDKFKCINFDEWHDDSFHSSMLFHKVLMLLITSSTDDEELRTVAHFDNDTTSISTDNIRTALLVTIAYQTRILINQDIFLGFNRS